MKKVLLGFIVLLFLIQAVRPEKNSSNITKSSIEHVVVILNEVNDLLHKACYDCHSNSTNYPWYSDIAPVSWFIAYHVNKGKKHLNFSEWTAYNKDQKKHVLKDLMEVMEEQEMPLSSYVNLHDEAKLTKSEFIKLKRWIETLQVD